MKFYILQAILLKLLLEFLFKFELREDLSIYYYLFNVYDLTTVCAVWISHDYFRDSCWENT